MKQIRTEDAVGHVLCHDMTQIIPGESADDKTRFKGVRFKKGHVVEKADISVLLSMGKEHLYVWELGDNQLHENDAAYRMAALCHGENCLVSKEPHEGKLTITAAVDGVFELDTQRLNAVNAVDEVMIATRRGNIAVKKGAPLAGTRVIPLVVDTSVVEAAEAAADVEHKGALMRVVPFCIKTAAILRCVFLQKQRNAAGRLCWIHLVLKKRSVTDAIYAIPEEELELLRKVLLSITLFCKNSSSAKISSTQKKRLNRTR